MPSDRISAPAATPDHPSPEIRGWIGLFLFVHLFAVAVGLTAYTLPSALQQRLCKVLGPYIGTLNFDLNPNSYPSGRFYLTHAREGDVDFLLEIEGMLPDGSVKTETVPMPGLWPGERRRHYQALANAAGIMASNEELESLLPRSISGSLLKQWGANRGLVRCRAHTLLSIEFAKSTDAHLRDPFDPRYYSTVYEAHVLISPDGRVDLLKKSAAGEVAPVEKER